MDRENMFKMYENHLRVGLRVSSAATVPERPFGRSYRPSDDYLREIGHPAAPKVEKVIGKQLQERIQKQTDAMARSHGLLEEYLRQHKMPLQLAGTKTLNPPLPKSDSIVSEGWIEWKGGPCPVPEGTKLEVQYLPPSGTPRRTAAGKWPSAPNYGENWMHATGFSPIVAYRIVP